MTHAETLDNSLQLRCLGIPCIAHTNLVSLFLNWTKQNIFLHVSLFICYRHNIFAPTCFILEGWSSSSVFDKQMTTTMQYNFSIKFYKKSYKMVQLRKAIENWIVSTLSSGVNFALIIGLGERMFSFICVRERFVKSTLLCVLAIFHLPPASV